MAKGKHRRKTRAQKIKTQNRRYRENNPEARPRTRQSDICGSSYDYAPFDELEDISCHSDEGLGEFFTAMLVGVILVVLLLVVAVELTSESLPPYPMSTDDPAWVNKQSVPRPCTITDQDGRVFTLD